LILRGSASKVGRTPPIVGQAKEVSTANYPGIPVFLEVESSHSEGPARAPAGESNERRNPATSYVCREA
jgi:hypothetical protein